MPSITFTYFFAYHLCWCQGPYGPTQIYACFFPDVDLFCHRGYFRPGKGVLDSTGAAATQISLHPGSDYPQSAHTVNRPLLAASLHNTTAIADSGLFTGSSLPQNRGEAAMPVAHIVHWWADKIGSQAAF